MQSRRESFFEYLECCEDITVDKNIERIVLNRKDRKRQIKYGIVLCLFSSEVIEEQQQRQRQHQKRKKTKNRKYFSALRYEYTEGMLNAQEFSYHLIF